MFRPLTPRENRRARLHRLIPELGLELLNGKGVASPAVGRRRAPPPEVREEVEWASDWILCWASRWARGW
jgi:hypothetical protein